MITQLITKWPSRNPLIVLISYLLRSGFNDRASTEPDSGKAWNTISRIQPRQLSAEPVAGATVSTIEAGWQAIPD